MAEGYVKMYRSVLDWEWYSDEAATRLFIHLLLTVNYLPGRFRGEEVQPGSTITSLDNLAGELGWNRSKLRRTLDKLKATGEVTTKTTNHWTTVTLGNWAKYQGGDQQTDQQTASKPTNKRPTDGPTSGPTTGNNRRREEGKKERREEGKNQELPLTGITPAKPVNGYGDQAINELMAYLKNANGGMTDGTDQENRRFCQHLINKARKAKPDADPVEGIKIFIDRATKLEWHGPRCTNFPYLYRHMTELVNLIKNPQQQRTNGSESIADKTQGVLDILRSGRL